MPCSKSVRPSANPWTITAWAYENSDGTDDFVANYGRIMVIDDGTALQLESGASGDGEFYTWDRQGRYLMGKWVGHRQFRVAAAGSMGALGGGL